MHELFGCISVFACCFVTYVRTLGVGSEGYVKISQLPLKNIFCKSRRTKKKMSTYGVMSTCHVRKLYKAVRTQAFCIKEKIEEIISNSIYFIFK